MYIIINFTLQKYINKKKKKKYFYIFSFNIYGDGKPFKLGMVDTDGDE